MTQVNTDRSKELGAKSTNFIPLSDLLKRNHNDRVKYHLANLEGQGATGEPSGSATANASSSMPKGAIPSKHPNQEKIAYDV